MVLVLDGTNGFEVLEYIEDAVDAFDPCRSGLDLVVW